MDIVRTKPKLWLPVFCVAAFIVAFLLSHSLMAIKNKVVLAVEPDSCLSVPANQIDNTAPFGDGIVIPPGFAVDQISIKSGSTCFGPYSSDGTYEDDATGEDSCYQITGLETGNVSVVKVGTGDSETCGEISQIEVTWEDDSPPGSPTPTISLSPSLSPSPTPMISVTPTAEITPTPIDEQNPSPTPTNSLSPSISLSPTPTPTGSTQGSSTTNDQNTSNGGNSSNTQGQVLGASTLAGTGLRPSLFAKIGLLLLGISVYGLLQISSKEN